MLIVLFAILCGLIGEGFEVWRLRASGLAMPGMGLRLTLFALYAAVGAAAGLLAVFTGTRRWKVAAALFALALFVPWANFELLPSAASMRSVLSSLAVAAVAAALGWLLASLPRATAVVLASLAIAANIPAPGRIAPATADRAAVADLPNLVLIMVDTLRADHLGVYGYGRPTSPRIDQLAREGVRFDRAIAQAPWTKPSIASLFTGRYVHRHGVMRSLDALGADLPTLASVLVGAGYRTAAFSANPWITPEFRFDRGFQEFESGRAMGPQLTNAYRTVRRSEAVLNRAGVPLPMSKWIFRWAGRENVSNTERDEAQVRRVLRWLAKANSDVPWFLYVHMIGPHDPYDPPEEFARAFARAPSPGERLTPARVETRFDRAEPLAEDRLERLIDQYDAAIAHADPLVGRILDELARRGFADNTIVVLTSDHGEEFYEHGNWRHGNQLYDEVVRVPLLIRDPKGERGAVRHDPAMLVDLLPTTLALLGVPAADDLAEIDGRVLFPAPSPADRPAFTEHWWFEGGTYVARAVEHRGLKLQSAHDEGRGREGEALYDLRQDPAEQSDLLGRGTYEASDLTALRRVLADIGGDGPRESAEVLDDIDPATRERLRKLGYLEDDEKR